MITSPFSDIRIPNLLLIDPSNSFPRVPVHVLLWLTDEVFPAQISFLFDATIEHHLPLDVIFGLVSELCFRLGDIR